jgi:hypothetical protein
VRFGRTAKGKKRTAKPLPCIFHENARQSAHGGILHGKGTLPCVFLTHARQWSFAVRQKRRTANKFVKQKT